MGTLELGLWEPGAWTLGPGLCLEPSTDLAKGEKNGLCGHRAHKSSQAASNVEIILFWKLTIPYLGFHPSHLFCFLLFFYTLILSSQELVRWASWEAGG